MSATSDHIAEGTPFSLLLDTPLAGEVRLASWCPTMDLCAVVTADGQLKLHRLSWQVLWVASPEALITALCWRPDGKALATGHADGSLRVCAAESGDVIAHHAPPFASIAHLSWAGRVDGAAGPRAADAVAAGGRAAKLGAPPPRHWRLFAPPPPPAPQASGGGAAGGAAKQPPEAYGFEVDPPGEAASAAWGPTPPALSLLVAADQRGRLGLWLGGEVEVGDVDAAALAAAAASRGGTEQPATVRSATCSGLLGSLLLVTDDPKGGVSLASLSLGRLAQRQGEVQQVALLSSLVASLLEEAADKTLEGARRAWQGAMAEMTKQMDTLEAVLTDHGNGAPSDCQGELLALLAAGAITPGLASYLTVTLGEAGLRRLARNVDQAVQELHTLLLQRLLPPLTIVTFLLGELKGLAAWPGRVEALGLQLAPLQRLEAEAAAALLRAEQLRAALVRLGPQYRSFFAWLLRTVRALEYDSAGGGGGAGAGVGSAGSGGFSGADVDAQVEEVAVFLEGQFLCDSVGPELQANRDEAAAGGGALLRGSIPPGELQELMTLVFPVARAAHADADAVAPGAYAPGATPPARGPAPPAAFAVAASSPAAADAAANGGGAALCARPLARQVRHTLALCAAAFSQPKAAIVPSIRLAGALRLLPPSPSPATAGGALGAAAAAAAAGSAAEASLVAVGPPLPPRGSAAAELHTTVACRLAPPPAAAGGCERLLLTRLPAAAAAAAPGSGSAGAGGAEGSDGDDGGGGGDAFAGATACVLELPAGARLVDAAVYRGDQVALLLRDEGGGGAPDGDAAGAASSSSSSRLALATVREDAYTAVATHAHATVSVAEQCVAAGAVHEWADLGGVRERRLPHARAQPPLAVSRSRGLACVASDLQRVAVFDFEDDEGSAGAGSEGDGDGMSEE